MYRKRLGIRELAHVIMEADESWDLQWVSWRPRRADG